METKKPKIDIDIEELLNDNKETIEDTLTKEIQERIRKKIHYDLGLGSVVDEWMEENVVPAVIEYFDGNQEVIVKKYLSAYEQALNKALEKRANDMIERSTSFSFQKALKEL